LQFNNTEILPCHPDALPAVFADMKSGGTKNIYGTGGENTNPNPITITL
jgi:hypothetical protein